MSSSKSKNKGMKALIAQFASITGASEEDGRKLLDVCNGNLEMAIGMQLEGGIQGIQASRSGTETIGSGNEVDAAGPSFTPMDDDNVRAPDPQKQEVLVPDLPMFGPRPRRKGNKASVFDKFRDFQAETKQQEEMIRRGESSSILASKKKTLEDLFRPPLDIMHKGTLNTAREHGQGKRKWVIVNVQNVQEFSCQQLNRDVWSDPTVKSIIMESFVFWQVYHDSDEGKRYMQFYKVGDFPYVAVLDPRTGEQMASWNRLDNMSFCDLAIQFLSDHPMFDQDGISPPPAKRIKTQKSIIDASEDSQLEAAIAASLAESSSTGTGQQDTEPAIPSAATSSAFPFTSVRNKIISIPDDDDSDAFQSVNGGSSDENSDGDSEVALEVLDFCKDNKNTTEKLERSTSSDPRRTGNQRKGARNGDEETGERTKCKRKKTRGDAGTVASSKSSNVKELGECSRTEQSCQQNGATKPQESSPDRTDENRVACDADVIDPSNACNLMLRLPDGRRKQVMLQATDPLLSLVQLIGKEGFPNERYELVTNFPRRRLSYLDIHTNLKAAGLFPQETIFIQER